MASNFWETKGPKVRKMPSVSINGAVEIVGMVVGSGSKFADGKQGWDRAAPNSKGGVGNAHREPRKASIRPGRNSGLSV